MKENIAESLLPLCVDIASVKTDKKNNRQHPERNLKALMTSLETYGQRKPIVVNADTKVIEAGNGLYLAAFKLGWSKIAAVMVKDDPNTAKGYAIMDNQSGMLSEWDLPNLGDLLKELEAADFNMDLTGFSDDEIKKLTFTENEGLTDPDEIPEQVETVCKKGDLWQLGDKHRLLCGDSTNPDDVKRLMNGESPVLCVTDPPYGVDYDPNWRNEAADKGLISHAASRVGLVSNDDKVDWREAWSLVPSDVMYCWHADRHASLVQSGIEAVNFGIRCQIIWAKQTFAISRGNYHWRHEPCWYAIRKGKTAHWIGDRSQSTLWEITWDKNVEGGHSTQKPVECMYRPINNHEGDVYDPFGGSGTTLIACEKLNRRCYMMEIDEHYCDVIIQRWQNFTGKKAFKLNDKIQLPPSHRIKEAVK